MAKKRIKTGEEEGVVESFAFKVKAGSRMARKLQRIEEETKKKFVQPRRGGVIHRLTPRDVEKIVDERLDKRIKRKPNESSDVSTEEWRKEHDSLPELF